MSDRGPLLCTGPNDPVDIEVAINDDRDTVSIEATFDDGRPPVEITIDMHRAEHVGNLLLQSARLGDQRLYDEGMVAALLMNLDDLGSAS